MTLPTIITRRIGQLIPRLPERAVSTPVPPPQPSGADAVGVFDDNFKQLFVGARPMRASVYEASKVMDHPIESGATITDHRVIQPIEIELSMMLSGDEYRDVYNQIKSLYNQAALLIVQTKTASYPNMLIAEIPHDESPDTYDSIPLALRLREALLITVQFQALPPKSVAKKRAASTVKRGQQTATTEPVNAATGKQDSTVLLSTLRGSGIAPGVFGIHKMGQRIPLDAIPNQQITARLDNHRYVITVKDIGDMMAVTIERDDIILIQGVRACAGMVLLPYPVLSAEFGNFIFTNTVPGNAPYFTDFGTACFLVYVTAAEVEAAVNG